MSQCEDLTKNVIASAKAWYESKRNKKGTVNFNVMAVGLAVAGFVKQEYPLTEPGITSDNGKQVKGLNKSFIDRKLESRGIVGKVPSEGVEPQEVHLPLL